ncbi:STAS domain-containing protein [Amycolatopsis sp. SID8362]|uniref:STAS domain-containing protein n=1 Tax=Amycolatopsis sp. SID8362 TaxID=2690346 RepID=UPI00136DBFB6|nr:STAS domain-containing protein [Amycolatopsis sp. SID8362]NBH09174.1 STAS domain-containing protein [Amycolatopsis sp. SID8362]NED45867.1 STAS domain-containing protein [Amycolatopsis sp. SID8362]
MHDIFRTVYEPAGLTATTTERPGGIRVITLVGDIDAATVGTLDEALATGDRIVADLTRVAFLSCAGVRSLLEANDRTGLALVVSGHAVTRSLEATGADLVLNVHPRVGAALAGLTTEPGGTA